MPAICLKDGKPAILKKLFISGGSLSVVLTNEWLRQHPYVKKSRKVLMTIEKGNLIIMPYNNEPVMGDEE